MKSEKIDATDNEPLKTLVITMLEKMKEENRRLRKELIIAMKHVDFYTTKYEVDIYSPIWNMSNGILYYKIASYTDHCDAIQHFLLFSGMPVDWRVGKRYESNYWYKKLMTKKGFEEILERLTSPDNVVNKHQAYTPNCISSMAHYDKTIWNASNGFKDEKIRELRGYMYKLGRAGYLRQTVNGRMKRSKTSTEGMTIPKDYNSLEESLKDIVPDPKEA